MLCSFVSLGAISSKLVPIGEHHGILSGKTFQEVCGWVSDSFLIFAPFCLPSCLAHPLRQWLESSGGGEGTVSGLWQVHPIPVQIQTIRGPWAVPVWGLEARRWESPLKLLLHREVSSRRDMMWKGRKWALKTCLVCYDKHLYLFFLRL